MVFTATRGGSRRIEFVQVDLGYAITRPFGVVGTDYEIYSLDTAEGDRMYCNRKIY